jgi:hypothetical protein
MGSRSNGIETSTSPSGNTRSAFMPQHKPVTLKLSSPLMNG